MQAVISEPKAKNSEKYGNKTAWHVFVKNIEFIARTKYPTILVFFFENKLNVIATLNEFTLQSLQSFRPKAQNINKYF